MVGPEWESRPPIVRETQMFEMTLLDAELLGDSDVRLNRAINALAQHIEATRDLETGLLLVPIVREIIQQSDIMREVYARAVDKGNQSTA
jgi:hypothetical protein